MERICAVIVMALAAIHAPCQWEIGSRSFGAISAAPSTPLVRGISCQNPTSVGSATVTWPSGSAAGDLAEIYLSSAYTATPPPNWTIWQQQEGAYVNGYAFSKLLSAADITAGSLTITASGSYDLMACVVTFQGNTNGIREVDQTSSHSSFTSPQSTSSSANIAATDLAVYFASNRGNSTDTFNRGTSQYSSSTTNLSGALYTEALAGAGSYSISGSYSNTGTNGFFQALTAVMGEAPSYPIFMRTTGIASASSYPLSPAFDSNKAGDRIVVAVTGNYSTAGTVGVTDASGNSYATMGSPVLQTVGGILRQTIFFCAAGIAASSGTNTLTISQAGGTYSFAGAVANEYSGGSGSCTPDGTITANTGTGTAMSTGSFSVTANDLVIGWGQDSNNSGTLASGTQGAGYYTRGQGAYLLYEDGIVNGTSANPSATAGLSGNWLFVGVALQ